MISFREQRQIISQLRQDNTELRHRLRHSGGGASALNTSTTQHTNAANTELSNANAKLRKQVENLKRDLQDSSVAYEKLRTESAREIARWKLKIGSSVHDSPGSSRGLNSPGGDGNAAAVISDLRRQLSQVQKELRAERLSRGANASASRSWGRGSPEIHSWSSSKPAYNRSYSADRARSNSAGRMTSTSPTTGRAVRDTMISSRADWRRTIERPTSVIAGRSASPNLTRPNYATPRSR